MPTLPDSLTELQDLITKFAAERPLLDNVLLLALIEYEGDFDEIYKKYAFWYWVKYGRETNRKAMHNRICALRKSLKKFML